MVRALFQILKCYENIRGWCPLEMAGDKENGGHIINESTEIVTSKKSSFLNKINLSLIKSVISRN